MEIKLFQSDQGDCLLLTVPGVANNIKHHILVDGGMKAAFQQHVSSTLGEMKAAGEVLDLVCVSHIDQDHIQGILELLDQIIDWRVFNFQKANNNTHVKKPSFPEPPEIKEIWHNAFSEIFGKNTGSIVDALANYANILSGGTSPAMVEAANYATSIKQAILLSRKIDAKQLGIPLNSSHDNKLVMFRQNQNIFKIGKAVISIIAPMEPDLKKLRKDWNEWLEENKKTLAAIGKSSKIDEDRLKNDALSALQSFANQADELGNRNEVTVPNLASIMFLLEVDGKNILMTGDGHGDDILKGLKKIGSLDTKGAMHVNVLKVQHHGSEHNLDEGFCRKITADNYLFCGNGAHNNPDIRVLNAILKSRIGKPSELSKNAAVNNPFKFWFNSSSEVTPEENQEHMRKVEKTVSEASNNSNGKFTFEFMPSNGSFLSLDI